MTDRLAR